jgi:hypothetical protein
MIESSAGPCLSLKAILEFIRQQCFETGNLERDQPIKSLIIGQPNHSEPSPAQLPPNQEAAKAVG